MIQAERDDLNIAEAQMLAREYLLANDSTLTKAAQDLKWRIARAVLMAAMSDDHARKCGSER